MTSDRVVVIRCKECGNTEYFSTEEHGVSVYGTLETTKKGSTFLTIEESIGDGMLEISCSACDSPFLAMTREVALDYGIDTETPDIEVVDAEELPPKEKDRRYDDV